MIEDGDGGHDEMISSLVRKVFGEPFGTYKCRQHK